MELPSSLFDARIKLLLDTYLPPPMKSSEFTDFTYSPFQSKEETTPKKHKKRLVKRSPRMKGTSPVPVCFIDLQKETLARSSLLKSLFPSPKSLFKPKKALIQQTSTQPPPPSRQDLLSPQPDPSMPAPKEIHCKIHLNPQTWHSPAPALSRLNNLPYAARKY